MSKQKIIGWGLIAIFCVATQMGVVMFYGWEAFFLILLCSAILTCLVVGLVLVFQEEKTNERK